MNTYLTIMVTVLVVTQIIRITQNTIQLRRQNKLFEAELGQIDDITQEDLDIQRRAYRSIVDHFERIEKIEKFCFNCGARVVKECEA